MAELILIILAVEKSIRTKAENHHTMWFAGKLIKCARQAGAVGWLNWRSE